MIYLSSYPALREQIRRQKNQAIQSYFHRRIYHHDNPYQIWGRSHPLRVLLILSHMRSGSSLLTHILSQNPAILGYGETHITYQTPQDIKQLMVKVYWQCHDFRQLSDLKHLRMTHHYVLDKVLHNRLLADESLLKQPQVSVIFLIREPTSTLASLQKLKPHLDYPKQFFYYKNRLLTLGRYAELIHDKERSLWLTYDQILDETETVFNQLHAFLGTDSGFSEQYQIMKTTGQKGVGDSHGKIKSGTIIRNKPTSQVHLPQDIQAEAEDLYQSTYDRLYNFCTAGVPRL
ncbi:sulfotransferase family protein [Geitlerinema sp. P-1104]|uniref:sulfotransferase n=1 Tax=Geitlerinema sp. P-1104 TaxID=2546230 RepID=UPI0014776CA8|nr:sulfotransferase domain-containing protein [Geitlerinema sp. P-1104]NMG60086.1 sulfotransferase family protein [Geitlerinema sp. P-1104]